MPDIAAPVESENYVIDGQNPAIIQQGSDLWSKEQRTEKQVQAEECPSAGLPAEAFLNT